MDAVKSAPEISVSESEDIKGLRESNAMLIKALHEMRNALRPFSKLYMENRDKGPQFVQCSFFNCQMAAEVLSGLANSPVAGIVRIEDAVRCK